MTESPYAKYVEGRDILTCLVETPWQIESTVRDWSPEMFERSYAPGKWSARQLLVHLAQVEIVFATRLRFALAVENYVVQPFDQDDWIGIEPDATAEEALAAYLGVRRLNLTLCRALTPAQRARRLTHPEFGQIDVAWVIATFAGHERHHLPQLEEVRRSNFRR